MAKSALLFLSVCAYSVAARLSKVSKSIAVLSDGTYELQISFSHAAELPIGSPTDCVPNKTSDFDGLPFLAIRERYMNFDDEIIRVTGFNGLSLDWVSCGHPPLENFGKPHYDVHFYYPTVEFRETMTCITVPGAPICDPAPGAQATKSGEMFFELMETTSEGKFINMPATFTVEQASAIPKSGIHYWDKAGASLTQDWINPVLVMGSYASRVSFWEPMIPMEFFSGNSTSFDSGRIDYTPNSDSVLPSQGLFKSASLPTSYTASYQQDTSIVTVVVKGFTHEDPIICISAAPDAVAAASAAFVSVIALLVAL